MTDKQIYQIGLTMINGVGDILARHLLEALGDAEAVFTEKRQSLEKIPGIGDSIIAEIKRADVLLRAEKELAFAQKNGISIYFLKDMNYPERLRECPDAPVLFYFKGNADLNGSPDKSGGKFFNSIENLHLCTMNNQGLLALAQLILPSEILSNFEVVRVEEEASLIRIYLDESVKAEYKENPEIESKGFCEAVTIRDFPIRDKGVDLIVRRRKWYDKQNNRYFSDSYDLKAEETRYSKEFAAFLKGVYGDDSYDLPFA